MAQMDEFIAFRVAIALLEESGQNKLLDEVYRLCKQQENLPKEEVKNYVRRIYEPFTAEEISKKMADMLRPDNMKTEIHIVYQSLEGLHKACPNSPGDWYFSGNYPTPGGVKRLNKAFIDFYEQRNGQAS